MDAHPASKRPATARSLEMKCGSRKDRCGWPLPRNVIIFRSFPGEEEAAKRRKMLKKEELQRGPFFELFAPFCGPSPLFSIAALAFERSLPPPQRSPLAKL